VSVDQLGKVFIADTLNSVIRMVTTDGTIYTVAGTGIAGYTRDRGPATSAQFNNPRAVSVDATSRVIVADNLNSVIRIFQV
jgi:hypothetical protein